jgi:hypothetical protein
MIENYVQFLNKNHNTETLLLMIERTRDFTLNHKIPLSTEISV